MRRETALIAFMAVLLTPALSHAFLPTGVAWPDDQLPLTYAINERASDDLTFTELEQLFAEAFASWTDVACTTLEVQYEGSTATEPSSDDDEHVMAFIESGWLLGPTTLAASAVTIQSLDPYHITADISFNGQDITWREGGSGGASILIIDPLAVFTHEIGHMLGLSHTNDDGAATMFDAYLFDLGQRTLSHDDKWGICSIYPDMTSTGECDPANDMCPAGSTCEPRDNWNFCIEERDGFGAFCSVAEINCQALCAFTDAMGQSGFCTNACMDDTECAPEAMCGDYGGFMLCLDRPPMPEPEPDMGNGDVADTSAGIDFGFVPPDTAAADTTVPDAAAMPDGSTADTVLDGPGGGDDDCACTAIQSSDEHSRPGALAALIGALLMLRRRRSNDIRRP